MWVLRSRLLERFGELNVADEPALRHDLAEAIELIERLDAENEHLRQRLSQTLMWWEDDVTAYIDREHDLEVQVGNLTREVDALNNTITMRASRLPRRVLASLRNRLGR